jgi:hypothetical protein
MAACGRGGLTPRRRLFGQATLGLEPSLRPLTAARRAVPAMPFKTSHDGRLQLASMRSGHKGFAWGSGFTLFAWGQRPLRPGASAPRAGA